MNTVSKSMLDLQPIDWLGLHRDYLFDGEMEVLAALARNINAKTMIEFGCRDGRTAHVLLHHVPTLEHYVGVDVPMSYQPGLPFQRANIVPDPGIHARADPQFELIIRDRGSLDLAANDLPRADVVFIDGDHSARAVEHDSALARAVLRNGGLIIWHDYKDDPLIEVRQIVDRLAAHGWPINHIEDTWLAISRVP
jgi:predicted O-methyltransferase YrrM